ncbi:helix-turn-helix domain-containing protein [Aurantimonas sp. 22II-16-19i]|uniref:helix-turn-helix domain-containing protein n=1 Tax=Aurantimonas sp. 22II-16-19i TaxID=1317114 RepID=UPI0009F7E51E|nr:helix-turn-helix domain-containing protein [Aurantimonas sp. 22II-16-19i]ORE90454.1 helix-turn-helix domain-containing protein [Aurantimonas sp. 22II-16-19i]
MVQFSTETMRPADRFEAYRSLYAGGTDAIRLGSQFSARLEARPLGEIVAFERWLDHVGHDRTMRRIRQDGFEHFVMQLNLSGRLVAHTGDGAAEVRPGEIILLDTRRPYRTECDRSHILTFSIARYVVERAFFGPEELHGRILSPPGSALLADFMISLNRHARTLSDDALTSMMTVFTELLAIALRPGEAGGSSTAAAGAKLEAARRVIEAELPRRDLGPDLIAMRIGVSRSRLYELFKPLGGVASYVQLRRAHRFRALLSQPRDLRSIAELAFACGFASESHASRSFRATFAVPPGQFRRRQLEVPHEAGRIAANGPGGFDRWVSSLTMLQPAPCP